MLTTQSHLDQRAARLERAYRRRHPNWLATGLTPGVWGAAAARLMEAGRAGSGLPVDPELFVAVQDCKSFRPDPWAELTQERAARAYRVAIRKIVQQLRAELKAELRWSRRHLLSGQSLDQVFNLTKSRVSPIAKLVLCEEWDRTDLAESVRPAAEAQHQACPLYRLACKDLMTTSAYPAPQPPASSAEPVATPAGAYAWN